MDKLRQRVKAPRLGEGLPTMFQSTVMRTTDEGFLDIIATILEMKGYDLPCTIRMHHTGPAVWAAGRKCEPKGPNPLLEVLGFLEEILGEAELFASMKMATVFPWQELIDRYPILQWVFLRQAKGPRVYLRYESEGRTSTKVDGDTALLYFANDIDARKVRVTYTKMESEQSVIMRLLWKVIMKHPTGEHTYFDDWDTPLYGRPMVTCGTFRRYFGVVEQNHSQCGVLCRMVEGLNEDQMKQMEMSHALGLHNNKHRLVSEVEKQFFGLEEMVKPVKEECDDGCPFEEEIGVLVDDEDEEDISHLILWDEEPPVSKDCTSRLGELVSEAFYETKWEVATFKDTAKNNDVHYYTLGRLTEGEETRIYFGHGGKLKQSVGDASRAAYLSFVGDVSVSPVTAYSRIVTLQDKFTTFTGPVLTEKIMDGSAILHFDHENDIEKVALIRERPWKPYTLIGGKKEGNETPEMTMKREFGEEVGDKNIATPFIGCRMFKSGGCTVFNYMGKVEPTGGVKYFPMQKMPRDIAPWVLRVLYRYQIGKEMPPKVLKVFNYYTQLFMGEKEVDGPIPIKRKAFFYERQVADRGMALFKMMEENFQVFKNEWK
jgi:hypothetical protein